MPYIILRGRWCNIIVSNLHAPTEDKGRIDSTRNLNMCLINCLKYHMKLLLGNFNDKVGREEIFKLTIGNESLHEIINDNEIRYVNFFTSKILRVKSTMFPHRIIHKYTWTCPDRKLHNHIYHIRADRRRHSNVLDVRSHRAADCDTGHYLVVVKVRE
jgi:hypothetical protein